MKLQNSEIQLSATDLVNFLESVQEEGEKKDLKNSH